MKTINFNKNDFPLTTNVLGFMQEAIQAIERITGILSGNYILSGCETVGGAINSGWVVVSGEIMPFAGGAAQAYVRVIVSEVSHAVQDAFYTMTSKQLVLGSGSGQIAWATFKRASSVLENPVLTLSGLTGSAGLSRKVLEIGDWNMQTTDTKTVDDSTIPYENIRGIQILIRGDAGQLSIRPLTEAGSYSLSVHPTTGAAGTRVLMSRTASPGRFAVNDSYNQTSYNRGWILIDYIAAS